MLTIAASNLGMPHRKAVFGSLAAHEDFLEEAGYLPGYEIGGSEAGYAAGGFEWMDVRNPRNLLHGRMALALADAGYICSLHQSWRSTTVKEIAGRWKGLRLLGRELEGRQYSVKDIGVALGLAATIPYINSSLDRLTLVQAAAGKELPMVAYPNEQQPPMKSRFHFNYPEEAKRFAVLRHQPTAEELKAWGVLSADTGRMVQDMLAVQDGYGFKEVAADTKHLHEMRHGLQFKDPVGMVALLAKQNALPEMHLNLTDDPLTLQRIRNGSFDKTHHGRMLQAAFEGLPPDQQLLLVTEFIGSAAEHREVVGAVLELAHPATPAA